MAMPLSRIGFVAALALGAAGCCGECVATHGAVVFRLDAPLCSSRLPVAFMIDSVQVGTDTFAVHIDPEHLSSREFEVVPGPHLVGARVIGGLVWADTMVSVAAGQTLTDTLPFYCS